MADKFEIVWTDLALDDLQKTVEYLELNFTVKEKDRMGDEIERILSIVKFNPTIFPISDIMHVRKITLLKYN